MRAGVLAALLLMILTACSNGQNGASDGTAGTEPYGIEILYPLQEGDAFSPNYLPDSLYYSEEVLCRMGSLVLLRIEDNLVASTFAVYRISDTEIEELTLLYGPDLCNRADDAQAAIYAELCDAADHGTPGYMEKYLDSFKDAKGKVILKDPVETGGAWENEHLLKPGDERLDPIPEHIAVDFGAADIVTVITSYPADTGMVDRIFAYQRGKGKVMAWVCPRE